jgi:hypothetical protein
VGDSEVYLFNSVSTPDVNASGNPEKSRSPTAENVIPGYEGISCPMLEKFPFELSRRHVATDKVEQERCKAAGALLEIVQQKGKVCSFVISGYDLCSFSLHVIVLITLL